ncbi:zinc metalloproteinase nas-14-like isoform X2 [Ostrea edulis]|uniref:zinc metalloproteinase nas-14-like isoform X2 n=1 Tax=Ostrea edulis TaxID=37623 RepID=UPI0024AF3400|nr:zinc metalloproteinase nas-14-like isoform X2 [Ostrea edulis]
MGTTPFLFVWILLDINAATGLSCYNCFNIPETSTCTQTITCPDGKRCLLLNTGGNLTLGCSDSSTCAVFTGTQIIGKRDVNGLKTHCCDQDLCNGQPASTTTTPEVCMDMNSAFCSSPIVQTSICSDPDLSLKWCRKTCGKCTTTTAAPTTTTSTTTTVPCIDNKPDLCSAPGANVFFCSDPARAVQYCQKTCNKCDLQPYTNTHTTLKSTTVKTTIKPSTTTSTTTTTTTTPPPWVCEDYDIAHCSDPEVKTLVCPDADLNYLCRKTCNKCEQSG